MQTFAEALIPTEADAVCGAEHGERSDERVDQRNGDRQRDWDTRAGSVALAIPELRHGSYLPDWLPQHRRRARSQRSARPCPAPAGNAAGPTTRATCSPRSAAGPGAPAAVAGPESTEGTP
ncbi:transposase [Dactylosporangium aurantiacum]|uniref:Mutator family transposase n=1 Tax=Dactylosporangium aurantiacum TaxID=35754 RepID=A0A9Q9I8H5_9ACTN|nr:transposase [Dactylosporangium aurantiacum]